jgi:hypothetical protein
MICQCGTPTIKVRYYSNKYSSAIRQFCTNCGSLVYMDYENGKKVCIWTRRRYGSVGRRRGVAV